jgi:hypothetical protein
MTATAIFRLSVVLAVLTAAVSAGCSSGDDEEPTGATPDRTALFGRDAGDQASAVAAGDFNGDGQTDLALGAAFADGPASDRADSGEVLIFPGPITAGASLDAASGIAVTVYGAATGDGFGRALAPGDFDGDGTEDLAVGAPGARESAGSVYVLFGSNAFSNGDIDIAEGPTAIAEYQGERAEDFAGIAIAAAQSGGKGQSLIVGALLADDPARNLVDTGAVYVVEQPASGPPVSLAEADAIVYGDGAGDHLGEALDSGDVNGDGRGDLVLVAPFGDGPDESRMDCGETYVFLDGDLSNGVGGAAHVVYGADEGDQLGHSVAVGQADGEPGDDVWLGAVSADGPENTLDLAGEALLVLGGSGLAHVTDARSAGSDFVVYGPEKEARLGRAVAAGDIDGDGIAELLISAPNLNERRGRLFVVRGAEVEGGGDVFATGDDAGDVLGTEILGGPPIVVADLDGDGASEVIVSAAQADGPENARTDAGEAYVYWAEVTDSD